MRLMLLITSLLILIMGAVAQDYENDGEKEKFRRSEFKRLMKSFNMNSNLESKSDGSIDALYYEIKLDLDFSALDISYGEVTGRFKSKVNSLSQIRLDFENSMTVDSLGGNAVSFTHSNNELIIFLDQAYNIDDIIEITIYYNGSPTGGGFGSWSMTSSRAYTLSEPYGARDWWPCKDTPSDKPDSVDIYINVPNNYDAVSNGILIGTTAGPSNTVTWHWKEIYPIATYLVSLAIANDYVHFSDEYVSATNDTLPLEHWVYQNSYSTAQVTFAEVPDFMEALEYYFGPYPYYGEKYGMAEFGWGGGMEHQTITSIGGVSSSYRYIFVHELGHQWFGDQVTCKNFHHIWLNEGFASYSEALFEEYTYGTAAYHNYMDSQDHRSWWSGTIYIQDTTNVGSIFSNIVYDKGSWVLHMLRHVVGDSVFFNILKTYATHPDFTYGSAVTEDFQVICENISGMDLNAFFDQWIYNAGHPDYQYAWSVTQSGNKWITNLLIKQIQTHHIYTMPIDIKLQGTSWDSTVVVLNDTAYQRFYIESSVEPTNVLFDKDQWILKNAQLIVDGIPDPENYPPNTFVLEQNYPNPFNPETTIRFYSPYQVNVDLVIYDINGRTIRTFYFNAKNNGFNEVVWDGRNEFGKEVASGIYFYKLVSNENTLPNVRKLIKIE